MLRPGLEYIDSTKGDLLAKHIPFVKRTVSDMALIELTDSVMRVRIDDDVITRVSVATAVSNGTFDTDLTGRSEEHTSELQSLMRISYAVFCLKKKNNITTNKDQKRTKHHIKHTNNLPII